MVELVAADWFTGVESAIGGAAAGAAQSQTEWAGLKAQAVAGTLRMESGVAEACATACQVAFDGLGDELASVQRCARVDGLGTWQSGVVIAQKFRDKAGVKTPVPNSAVGVILAHQGVLVEMRDTFRAAGRAYSAAEQGNIDRVKGLS